MKISTLKNAPWKCHIFNMPFLRNRKSKTIPFQVSASQSGVYSYCFPTRKVQFKPLESHRSRVNDSRKWHFFQEIVKLFEKNSQEIYKKSPPWALRAIFRAILTKYSDFGHFWSFFLVKNSIFTTFRCKTGNGTGYHYISPTLGILKRYHTSPNSQYFQF